MSESLLKNEDLTQTNAITMKTIKYPQIYSVFHIFFNIVLEILANAIRQEKKIKDWEERNKIISAHEMIIYLKM